MSAHHCHYGKCPAPTPRKFLYCSSHWFMVTPATRARVMRAYQGAGGTTGAISQVTDEYLAATKQAHAEVARAEAALLRSIATQAGKQQATAVNSRWSPSYPKPTTIDFETDGVNSEDRPDYPPEPVGVSIKEWGKKSRYYAWGHTTKNNSTKAQAVKALRAAYARATSLLFHNAKFDVDVANEKLKLKVPHWSKIHDTMFLLFLEDPHQKELGLKPSAERLLGEPPEERDAVGDWLVENQPVTGVKISRSKQSETFYMKYLRYAPGDLVGEYACSDTDRTEDLFKLLYPRIVKRGMRNAYDRERHLMPILLESEAHGVPVDLKRLRRDVASYSKIHDKLTAWLRTQLKAPELNVDSGQQLVAALIKAKKVDLQLLGVTPKQGKPCSDKESLKRAVKDPRISAVLRYRTQLGTCLHTFMEPWLRTAERSGGLIYTRWHQTRSQDGGARTGRLSSSPNFQNIPNVFVAIFRELASSKLTRKERQALPRAPFKLPPLPQVRSYVVAFKGHRLFGRDYSQQELRVLGHFEDGVLKAQYAENPWLDVHEFARQMIHKLTGKLWVRKHVKNTGFGILYGMGLGLLAESCGITMEEAKELRDAYLAIFPGLKAMYQDMKVRAAQGLPIRTWGGREYYCEPPKIIKGRIVKFDYKMLNVLIQGSSADVTKEAIIRHHEQKHKDTRLLINIHDEILGSAPRTKIPKAIESLRVAMESVELDVTLLSEGYTGDDWADLDDYDKAGKRVA